MTIPYTLTHIPTNTDITSFVNSIDKFTHVGTGEVNSAQIMINTNFGGFITETNNGETPVIDQFDLFRLEITDDNSKSYSRLLYLDERLPQKDREGRLMELELFGREKFLQKMRCPGHFYFIKYIDLVKYIIRYYNEHKGTLQPEIVFTDTGINYLDIPSYPIGIFDFGDDMTCYDALMSVVGRLNLPVSASGAGAYYCLLFDDHSTDDGKLVCKIFPRGAVPSSPITVRGDSIDTVSIYRTHKPWTGSIVCSTGQDMAGFMPSNLSVWTGKIEEYRNFSPWDSTVDYPKGVYIDYNGKVYKSKIIVPASLAPKTDATFWKEVTLGDYLGANLQYSPLTKDKAKVWLNSASNPSNSLDTNMDSPAFLDSNGVIRDVWSWRDVALARIRRLGDIPSQYLYSATSTTSSIENRVYEGMSFLIDSRLGTIQSPFTGNDKRGKPYKDSLVQMDRDGDWIVVRNPIVDDQIAVKAEGKVYAYIENYVGDQILAKRKSNNFVKANLAWRDVSGRFFGNDCFHYPTSIKNVDGLEEKIVHPNGGYYTDNSAIEITYSTESAKATVGFDDLLTGLVKGFLGLIGVLTAPVLNLLATKEFYDYGWWAEFVLPFPNSKYNSITENVGELFGGDADTKVPVLDLNNLNYTADGETGYDSITSVDLGPLDALHFRFNYDILIAGKRLFGIGDIPFRCTIYDTEHNVWIQDFRMRFLGESQQVILPFAGFRIYRARAGIGFSPSDIVENIIRPERTILEIFEKRKVQRITIQDQSPYDEHGRYNPAQLHSYLKTLVATLIGTGLKHVGVIDAWGFVKTPLAIAKSADVTDYHIMPTIQRYPNVSNVEQLKKINTANLDLAQFRNDGYTIQTTGFCDILAENSIYVNDKDVVETVENGVSNNKKIVVGKIVYSTTAKDGHGGFLRDISAFEVINV